jgi:hypothetical protein
VDVLHHVDVLQAQHVRYFLFFLISILNAVREPLVCLAGLALEALGLASQELAGSWGVKEV